MSDKTGLVDFLRPWVQRGLVVYSTGGTAEHLRQHQIPVKDVSELTQFPEVLDGRVKTLHPHVHMSLLAKRDNLQHQQTLKEYNLELFDLVVCNLYPFEEAVLNNLKESELIEKIDIGGPTQLRAAAKNYQFMTVLSDPADYPFFAERTPNLEERKKLAGKVFQRISIYDQMIAKKLLGEDPVFYTEGGYLHQRLRYGENPHQQAFWYREAGQAKGWHQAHIHQGKELSYNNLLDLDAAVLALRLFATDKFSGVIVKHNNPCAMATAGNGSEMLQKLLLCDPVSMFGGIVAINQTVDEKMATRLSEIFLECVVAPHFETEALAVFNKKKNVRILEWKDLLDQHKSNKMVPIAGGFLVQEPDSLVASWSSGLDDANFSKQQIADLHFAEAAAAALKSNAIAVVRNGMTLGLGMGQTNRVDATAQALKRAQEFHGSLEGAVLASDAFFPFADSIKIIAEAGIRLVLQPGGSIKDEEVIVAAKSLGVKMIMTGRRHFRH